VAIQAQTLQSVLCAPNIFRFGHVLCVSYNYGGRCAWLFYLLRCMMQTVDQAQMQRNAMLPSSYPDLCLHGNGFYSFRVLTQLS